MGVDVLVGVAVGVSVGAGVKVKVAVGTGSCTSAMACPVEVGELAGVGGGTGAMFTGGMAVGVTGDAVGVLVGLAAGDGVDLAF